MQDQGNPAAWPCPDFAHRKAARQTKPKRSLNRQRPSLDVVPRVSQDAHKTGLVLLHSLVQTPGMDRYADLFKAVDTARLRLRCVRLEDAAPVSAMMTAAVSQWVASWPVPLTPEMATERITNARKAVADGRALPCAIERRGDGALVGWIGVTRETSHGRRAMLGYWLGEQHHGHGYMREAAPAMVRMAFQKLDLDVVEAAAQPENAASFAVLRGCGMAPVGERMIFAPSRNREEMCLLYEVTRPRI